MRSIIDDLSNKILDKYYLKYSIENCWKDYKKFKGFYIFPHISVTIEREIPDKKTVETGIWFGWIIWDFVIHVGRRCDA